MTKVSTALVVALGWVLNTAGAAVAQTSVIGGAGGTAIVDDETFLGRGPVVAGGIARAVGANVSLEGEVSIASHHRDAGYLAADGTPVIASGRVLYTFRRVTDRSRPFVGGGIALVHSTGTLTTHDPSGPGHAPSPILETRRDWSITQAGLDLGAGVLIRAGDRLAIRPEIRWISTRANVPSTSTIEPPLWIARPSVSLVWRIR
jgi:opacity protein-like surface antigen